MIPITRTYSITGLLLFVALTGCSDAEKSDAYGQFEATETTISSKASGELLSFTPREGRQLRPGRKVGLVDTTDLHLKREELQSQLHATRSKIENISAEADVQREQLQTAKARLERTEALVRDRAATREELDDIRGRVQALRKKIVALETQKQTVRAELEVIRARISQLEQQIKNSRIMNPVEGTVLVTYVEPHELVSRGQPLYQVADLDTLELRAYVSGAQLPSLRLGQSVRVLADKDEEENQLFEGQLSWIASEAEFTPKMIQTKEERVTQVYAVKIKVPNPDGLLKIGMPGEVNF